jgi:hypothetical protein
MLPSARWIGEEGEHAHGATEGSLGFDGCGARWLTSLAHRARTRPHLARGARIVLPCSEKTAGKRVARKLRSANKP